MFYEYCRTRLGVLYNGDALEVLPTIKENTVDLVITDPPYFVLNERWDRFKDIREYAKFTLDWLSEVYRVLKEGGQVYVFWSQKFLFEFYKILEQTKFTFKRLLIWYHPNLSVPTSKMYLWTYDPIFYLVKGDKAKCFHSSFIRKHNRDVFIIPKPQTWGNRKRLHIAQKPLKLAEIFILNSSDPNDIVLDPFLGSGTTAIAAERLRRRWIGIEINKSFCEIAKMRLKQKTLFGLFR